MVHEMASSFKFAGSQIMSGRPTNAQWRQFTLTFAFYLTLQMQMKIYIYIKWFNVANVIAYLCLQPSWGCSNFPICYTPSQKVIGLSDSLTSFISI